MFCFGYKIEHEFHGEGFSTIISKGKYNEKFDNLNITEAKKHARQLFSDELLNYGTFLTDDCWEENFIGWIRLRIIVYDDRLYYHKMCNGSVVEIKEIGRVKDEY